MKTQQPNIINYEYIKHNPENFKYIIDLIFKELTKFNYNLKDCYPQFNDWFQNKVIYGLYKNEREIILKWRNNKIAGISIIKNNNIENEKKICCLRVNEEFQNKGLGIFLFKESMERLETEKPLLSINENKIFLFNDIFNYFKYEKVKEYNGIYLPNEKEISYNGILTDY